MLSYVLTAVQFLELASNQLLLVTSYREKDMVDVTELADAAADLSTVATIAVGDRFLGQIGSDGDRDWVRVVLAQNSGYYFELSGNAAAGALFGTEIILRDQNGAVMDNSWSTMGSSGIGFDAVVGGTYYLDLGAEGNTKTGNYQLTSLVEVASNLGTQSNVKVGAVYSGRIDYDGDSDWVRVTLKANTGYYFELSGNAAAGAILGSEIVLRDQNGEVIDSSWSTMGASGIGFDAIEAGTYYLDLRSEGNTKTGN